MKKWVFLGLLAFIAVSGWFLGWQAAVASAALLFLWLARENHLRTRFVFLKGEGFGETSFELDGVVTRVRMARQGTLAVFQLADGTASARRQNGRQAWRFRPDSPPLDLLPLDSGGAYIVFGEEVVLLDANGRIQKRLAFDPPPFQQSYRLQLSSEGTRLLLHTPWFLQFLRSDLEELEMRIPFEAIGHYMKHAILSPDGQRVYFGGAKLLDDDPGTEARWGCWHAHGGVWTKAWSQHLEAPGNSHLRGLALSGDGSRLVVEIYHEGYEFRIFDVEGTLIWKRGGEYPVLDRTGGRVLWENPFEGLTLSDCASHQKDWAIKQDEKVRLKEVLSTGICWVWEGMQLATVGVTGERKVTSWFVEEPDCVDLARLGTSSWMAVAAGNHGAMIQVQT